MITKYGFDIKSNEMVQEITYLTNQLWKIIPMRENNEDWQKQLRTVINEIAGLNEILIIDFNLLQLLSKLEGILLNESMSFDFYRKTVFESIGILQRLKNNGTI